MIGNTHAQIKVALFGPVSPGKTTTKNALLGSPYSLMGMGRSTMAVNHICLLNSKNAAQEGWEVPISTPQEIMSQTVRDSQSTELNASASVERRFFKVQPSNTDEICHMHKDLRLVVVEYPGIDDADNGAKFKDALESDWKTFDVAMLVMDSRPGDNTKQQVELLEMVKRLNDNVRRIPFVALPNKVDDPDDPEMQSMLQQIYSRVETVFGVSDRKQALQAFKKEGSNEDLFPLVVPICARDAFLYRAAIGLSPDELKQRIDWNDLDRFGKNEFAKKEWSRWNSETKLLKVSESLSDPFLLKERMQVTGFDTLIQAIRTIIGDEKHQLEMVKEKLQVHTKEMVVSDTLIDELQELHEALKAMSLPAETVATTFWSLFLPHKEECMYSFMQSPSEVISLSKSMQLLSQYHKLILRSGNFADEGRKVLACMLQLSTEQLCILVNKGSKMGEWDCSSDNAGAAHGWEGLSPVAWTNIYRSVLLMSFHPTFCEFFGPWKVLLETIVGQLDSARCAEDGCECTLMKNVHYALENGPTACGHEITKLEVKLTFLDENSEKVHSVNVPSSLDDPKHWGHLVWCFCSSYAAQESGSP